MSCEGGSRINIPQIVARPYSKGTVTLRHFPRRHTPKTTHLRARLLKSRRWSLSPKYNLAASGFFRRSKKVKKRREPTVTNHILPRASKGADQCGRRRVPTETQAICNEHAREGETLGTLKLSQDSQAHSPLHFLRLFRGLDVRVAVGGDVGVKNCCDKTKCHHNDTRDGRTATSFTYVAWRTSFAGEPPGSRGETSSGL